MVGIPAWVYEQRTALDTARLDAELGDRRPTWTRHFTTWRAFKLYVAGVLLGTRTLYRDWFRDDEWERALGEVFDDAYRVTQDGGLRFDDDRRNDG